MAATSELADTVARLPVDESATDLASNTEEWIAGSQPAPSAGRAVRTLPEQFGRYRLERQLGAGGMGTVYAAHDTQLDRKVALKIPFFSSGDGPDAVERFHREARAMAALHHANLCPVFDVGQCGGVPYLTMALIDGHPLTLDLAQGKPSPGQQAAALIRKLAQALQYAHESGVVHRDLKPGNVMIRADQEPVIMDFGLARRHAEGEAMLTQVGTVLGTPAYMAPEQVRGDVDRIGPATDIYALGVMLYQMLTGRLPFSGSLGSTLSQILTETPPAPRELCPSVDPRLQAICLRAMARRIEDRYRTAGDLAADLQQLLEGRLAEARPGAPTRRQTLGRWVPALAAVVLLVCVAMALTLALSIHRRNAASPAVQGLNAAGGPTAGTDASRPDERWRMPPEPRRYPSFPDTNSSSPPWLVQDTTAPFDLAEYFRTPVHEENAATLYLDAFFEFNSEPGTCFPPAEQERRLPVARDRQGRFGHGKGVRYLYG